jgi:hypothetical protein
LLLVIPVIAPLVSNDVFLRAGFPLAFVIRHEKLFFICRPTPFGVAQINFSHLFESNKMQQKLLSTTPAGIAIGASLITVVVRPTSMAVPWATLKPSAAQRLAENAPITIDDLAVQNSAVHQNLRLPPDASPVFVRLRYIEEQIWLEEIPAETVARASHSIAREAVDDGFQAIGYLRTLRISKARTKCCGSAHPLVTALFLLAPCKVTTYSSVVELAPHESGLSMFSYTAVLQAMQAMRAIHAKGNQFKQPRALNQTTKRSNPYPRGITKTRRLALLYGRPRIPERPLDVSGVKFHSNLDRWTNAAQLSFGFIESLDIYENLVAVTESKESAARHA